MVWAHGKDRRGAQAKKGQSSYYGRSTVEKNFSKFDLLEGSEKGFSCHWLAGGKATCKRKECAERTCEGMIVLMQFEDDRCLHVV